MYAHTFDKDTFNSVCLYNNDGSIKRYTLLTDVGTFHYGMFCDALAEARDMVAHKATSTWRIVDDIDIRILAESVRKFDNVSGIIKYNESGKIYVGLDGLNMNWGIRENVKPHLMFQYVKGYENQMNSYGYKILFIGWF
jgi:hypothetical protein